MQHYHMALKITHLDQQGSLCGYASTFHHVDQHNDIMMPGAFQQGLEMLERYQQWPKMLWQHKLEQPIGIWTFMEEDRQGLYVEGRLLQEVQQGREAYYLLKSAAIDGLSIGFMPLRVSYQGKARRLHQVRLIEVSIVTLPANTQARVTHVKQF